MLVNKTNRMKEIEKRYNEDIRKLCYRLYHMAEKPLTCIAKEFGIASSSLSRWFNEMNIHIRTTSEANFVRFKNPKQRKKISETHRKGLHGAGYKKQSTTLKKKYASGELKPWNKGLSMKTDARIKPMSEEQKELRRKISKEHWKKPGYRTKVVRNSLKALFGNRPTSLEKKFIELIKKYNLSFKYVGDGSLIINGCNPDFVETNGKKLLIEVANRIHHKPYYEKQRYAIFAKYGFRTCTLWQEIFDGNDWEQTVLDKLSEHNFI